MPLVLFPALFLPEGGLRAAAQKHSGQMVGFMGRFFPQCAV